MPLSLVCHDFWFGNNVFVQWRNLIKFDKRDKFSSSFENMIGQAIVDEDGAQSNWFLIQKASF